MVSLPAVLLHAASTCLMAYGYTSLSGLAISTWIEKQRGGHFQFLTVQGLVVAWLTAIVSLADELGVSLQSLQVVRRIKRALLMITLPLCLAVALVYWPLIVLRPFLLQPDQLISDPSSYSEALLMFRLPLSVDLCLHAVPALSSLASFILFERKYSKNEVLYGAPLMTVLVTTWYGCWVEYCGRLNGVFPYPFLTNNPIEIRVSIYVGVASLAFLSFWIINTLHRRK